MREYDENHAYEEVREDFIKEYKAQLERRGNGEKLEIVAEGTPFESFTYIQREWTFIMYQYLYGTGVQKLLYFCHSRD